ncbi:hypothetical protein NP493_87g02061 [Ridgeia piscesae]|uniref:Uncharacterized protein n=1 Tax=Ridgeia piscesae TaxID=27915 RepID=A0AAD9UI81_RIDPI|nr:hypothetical protein NP493_87g02061 [Ridgeia piscesae]
MTLYGYKVKYSEQTIRNKYDITYDITSYKQLLLNCNQHGMSKMSLSFFKHLRNQWYTVSCLTIQQAVFKKLCFSTILQPILLLFIGGTMSLWTCHMTTFTCHTIS